MPALEKLAKKEDSNDWNDAWTAGDDESFNDADSANFQNFVAPPKVELLAEVKPPEQPIEEPRVIFRSPNPIFQQPQQEAVQEQSQQQIQQQEKVEVKESPKAQPQPPKSKPQVLEKCANSSDCQEDQFCVVKVGKCVKKFDLGAEGCAKHEQCLGSGIACVRQGKVNRCLKACKAQSDCGDQAYCASDKSAIKGLRGGFSGICKNGKAPKTGKELVSSAVSKGSSSGLFVPLTVAVGVLIGAVLAFLWLRSWMRKKNVQHDPKHFPFKPAPKPVLMDERLDNRLLKMPGARYTTWAPLE